MQDVTRVYLGLEEDPISWPWEEPVSEAVKGWLECYKTELERYQKLIHKQMVERDHFIPIQWTL